MTITKREKKKRKILDALNKAELSNNRGDFISTSFKLTRKNRKHSGRYTPILHQKGKFSEMIANAEEPLEVYDDWCNYRDGWRGSSDKTHLFKNGCSYMSIEEKNKSNKKIQKQIAIKKAKKNKRLIRNTFINPISHG